MRVLPGSCPVPARFLPDGRAGTASVGRFLRSEPGSNRRTTLGCCTTLVRTLPRRCGAWCGWDDLRYGIRNFGAQCHAFSSPNLGCLPVWNNGLEARFCVPSGRW